MHTYLLIKARLRFQAAAAAPPLQYHYYLAAMHPPRRFYYQNQARLGQFITIYLYESMEAARSLRRLKSTLDHTVLATYCCYSF